MRASTRSPQRTVTEPTGGLAGPVGTVAIRCGDKTLANISAVN